MQVTLAAIGKSKGRSLHHLLFEDYAKRLPWKIEVKEFEEKKPLSTDARKEKEAEFLLNATASCHRRIALDERGKNLTSPELSQTIAGWQEQGCSHLGIIIGGQDGLAPSLYTQANLLLSLGKLTWPHMLVRPLIAEQLYRCYTIQTGHPYHRV